MFQTISLVKRSLKTAEDNILGAESDKAMIDSDCDKIRKSPNILKKLIGTINYLTFNAKETFT